MILSRSWFFCWLFLLLAGPIAGYKLWWLAGTRSAIGVMSFVGHSNIESPLGITSYPVILFQLKQDSIFFNGLDGYGYKPGDPVPVRYRVSEPGDAKIDQPIALWGDTMVYLLFPVLIWLVMVLTPERFYPLVPRGRKILISRKPPFIRLLPLTR